MQGHQLYTYCMPKHLVRYQISIKEKKKSTEINFTNTDGFDLTFYDFFRGFSVKTDSSMKGENTTI